MTSQHQKEVKHRIYDELKEKEICTSCQKRKPIKDKILCNKCADKKNSSKPRYRKLCRGVGCGKYIEMGVRRYCKDCDTKENSRQRIYHRNNTRRLRNESKI